MWENINLNDHIKKRLGGFKINIKLKYFSKIYKSWEENK